MFQSEYEGSTWIALLEGTDDVRERSSEYSEGLTTQKKSSYTPENLCQNPKKIQKIQKIRKIRKIQEKSKKSRKNPENPEKIQNFDQKI